MALPAFSAYGSAHLAARTPVATEQMVLELEGREGALEAHVRAGQFCRVRVVLASGEAAEGIFAMLSAPHEGALRFLIRTPNPEGGEAADRIAELPVGAPLEMSLPAGDGFDLAQARGRDVHFVATGTAIAPVRAALEVVLREREAYGRLTLDHGLRSAAHLAITGDVERWRAAGVEVRLHYSVLDADGTLRGVRVQDALVERERALARAAIVAVGQSAMVKELRAIVTQLGGDPARVLHNY